MKALKDELKAILDRSGYSLKQGLILQEGGFTNVVFEARTDKGDFMVRVGKHFREDELALERTEYFMKRLYDAGAIDKRVVASGRLSAGVPYFIVEKVEGTVLSTGIEKGELARKEVLDALRAAIKAAKRITSIKMDGYGWIVKSQGGFRGWVRTELEDVGKGLEELDFLRSKGVVTEEYCKRVKGLIDENRELFDLTDPRLVFPDVHFGNIIVKNKEFEGLIDFDWMVSGDPVRSFTSLAFQVHNTYEHSDGPNVHTRYKDGIVRAMGLNKRQTKKLHLHTIVTNLSSMRWFIQLGERIDSRMAEYVMRKERAPERVGSLVGDFWFHKESNDELLGMHAAQA